MLFDNMKLKEMPSFHCHIQSLDSASTPEEFVKRELELGTGTITCTDHGTLAACKKVYDLAKENNLTPVIGLEGYFRDDNCSFMAEAGVPKNSKGQYSDYFKYGHVTMHCLDYEAYLVLVKRVSKAADRAEKHGSEYKPLFSWDDIEELGSKNITMGSGCLISMVSRHLLDNNNPDMAIKYYEKLRSLVKPGNFYAEVFPHCCDNNFVSGLFLTLKNGQSMKLHSKKWIKTNVKEIQAIDLVREFNRKDRGGHTSVLGFKDYRKWNDIEPSEIISIQEKNDFIDNEPCTWAKDGDLQGGVNKFIQYLAKKNNDLVVCSDDSHFAYPGLKPVQDVRLMAGGNPWRFSNSHHRMTSDESFAYFNGKMGMSELEFQKIIQNNIDWASRFKDFKFESKPSLPASFYPKDTLKHVGELITKHGRMRWDDKKYTDRLTKELDLFHKNGTLDFLPYFFSTEEICSAFEHGPGRGSSSGTLLAYLLGVTHVDPLEFGLSLERFMTLERIQSGKLPDVDMDFASRDAIVDPENGFLKNRFGDCFTQISTDIALKLKSSVKDVARVKYGKVPFEVEELTKKFKVAPQGVDDKDFIFGYEKDDGWEQGSLGHDDALKEYVKRYPKDWDLVQKLLGLGRARSRHPSAFVICDSPVSSFIPTMKLNGIECTQYTAQSVESVGGVKYDILVVNSLKDVYGCVNLIQKLSGVEIPTELKLNWITVPKSQLVPKDGKLLDLWRLWDTKEAKEVFNSIAEGNTETVFQLNTGGAVKWLSYFNQLRPNGEKVLNSINELAIFTALDRPGPLDAFVTDRSGQKHNMLVEYANRAIGKPNASGIEMFDGLIPETNGILIYQESVQKIYQQFTGCSLSDAEEFRSNVAKKKKDKMIKAHPYFMGKATEKIGKEKAQQVWDAILTFSNYGFCQAHAVSYSFTAFACAYLKHFFPLEWWTSVLSNADKNEINETFWIHCGHLVDLPDINKSEEFFAIQHDDKKNQDRIRAPIDLLDGIGDGAHQQICEYRPYKDINDFCRKIHLHKKKNSKEVVVLNKKTQENEVKVKAGHSAINRKTVYKLIISGAMDSLLPPMIEEAGVSYEPSVMDKLRMYEKAIAETKEEILPIYDAKGKVKKVSAAKVDPKYADINEISKYQLRKDILPAFSKDMTKTLFEVGAKSIVKCPKGFEYKPFDNKDDKFPIVNFIGYSILDNIDPFPDNDGIEIGVTGYLQEIRHFKYSNNEKEACEIVLDIGGGKCHTVKWPGRDGKLPEIYKKILPGSMVVALLSKSKEDKPFYLQRLEKLIDPLNMDSKEEGETE